MIHKRSKHIVIRHHFLSDMKVRQMFTFEYIPPAYNIADVLIKPLDKCEHYVQRFILMGSYAIMLAAMN